MGLRVCPELLQLLPAPGPHLIMKLEKVERLHRLTARALHTSHFCCRPLHQLQHQRDVHTAVLMMTPWHISRDKQAQLQILVQLPHVLLHGWIGRHD